MKENKGSSWRLVWCKGEDPLGGNTQRQLPLRGNRFLVLKKKKKKKKNKEI